MVKGRLSNVEKYAIQGMLHNEKEVKDMAKSLDRTETVINKYIDNELDNIHTTTTKVKLEKEIKRLKKEQQKTESIQEMKECVTSELVRSGAMPDTISEWIKRAIKQFGNPPNKEVLMGNCMKVRTAKDFMITQTSGKKERTVAIMTKEASERSDEFRKTMPTSVSRTARKNLFNISEQKIIE